MKSKSNVLGPETNVFDCRRSSSDPYVVLLGKNKKQIFPTPR